MALLDSLTSVLGQSFLFDPRTTPTLRRFGVPITNPSTPAALTSFGRPPGLDQQGVPFRNFGGADILDRPTPARLSRGGVAPVDGRGGGPLRTPLTNLLQELGIGQKVNLLA